MLEEAADGVFVATSRIDVTTSTVIVDGTECVLVDPAWTPAELSALAAEIARRGWAVSAGLATHAHHDHLLWHPGFGTGPRWGSAGTVQMIREHYADLLGALDNGSDNGSGDGPGDGPAAVADGEHSRVPAWYRELFARVAPVPGDNLPEPFGTSSGRLADRQSEPMELIVHDGHAPGHTALWLPHRRVLVAGDMLSDLELPLPLDPDDVPAYLHALDVLEPYVHRAEVLIPGHGTPTTDPAARLAADYAYFDDVRTGRPSADPRVDRPGMAAVDRRVRGLAEPH
ncbi:MBL fold metallo-hydrolase [Spelaeicoccus albus]|uniref:Glyoxylase-like metal-dependent hydrolase (Beta-lactamase superfamily II) n=1 Tax=Spelaeicoccus albus TaxID=1280376 RepID=A0A7Z0II63_9MICO|nr:MBL fold metallo-hydrolase [Spelaeicoccus albus]NYI68092.1 glyoxylase-like metal-dependent hydrolase (beta-lactamase superfamily II) [Spelaeicoccus albus]